MGIFIILLSFLLISIIILYVYNPYEDPPHIIPIGEKVFIHNGKEWVKVHLTSSCCKESEEQIISNDKHIN